MSAPFFFVFFSKIKEEERDLRDHYWKERKKERKKETQLRIVGKE
jgi:hypothetical protein